jgi:hypothetical protein
MKTTRIVKLQRVAIMLVAFAASGAPYPVAAASLDGSKPLLCAVNTIMECDGSGQCLRLASDTHPDFPSFLRVDVAERTITDGNGAAQPRTTAIKTVTRLDGRLILHGGENGRGWAATIAESSGRMSAGVVADEFAFALFGACTTP